MELLQKLVLYEHHILLQKAAKRNGTRSVDKGTGMKKLFNSSSFCSNWNDHRDEMIGKIPNPQGKTM